MVHHLPPDNMESSNTMYLNSIIQELEQLLTNRCDKTTPYFHVFQYIQKRLQQVARLSENDIIRKSHNNAHIVLEHMHQTFLEALDDEKPIYDAVTFFYQELMSTLRSSKWDEI